jgi:hypothetical protein
MGNRLTKSKEDQPSPLVSIEKEASITPETDNLPESIEKDSLNSTVVESVEPTNNSTLIEPTEDNTLDFLPLVVEDPHQIMIQKATAPLRAHLKRTLKPVPLSKREIKKKQKETNPPGEYTVSLNNLCHVKPYYHSYRTNAKGRWCGKSIIDVFRTEFKEKSVSYYQFAIETGLLVVNGEKIKEDYVVRMGDLINHMVHRHEPPISGTTIKIVDASVPGLVAIHKPAGYLLLI